MPSKRYFARYSSRTYLVFDRMRSPLRLVTHRTREESVRQLPDVVTARDRDPDAEQSSRRDRNFPERCTVAAVPVLMHLPSESIPCESKEDGIDARVVQITLLDQPIEHPQVLLRDPDRRSIAYDFVGAGGLQRFLRSPEVIHEL